MYKFGIDKIVNLTVSLFMIFLMAACGGINKTDTPTTTPTTPTIVEVKVTIDGLDNGEIVKVETEDGYALLDENDTLDSKVTGILKSPDGKNCKIMSNSNTSVKILCDKISTGTDDNLKADAGADQSVTMGNTVTLTASKSTGTISEYFWEYIGTDANIKLSSDDSELITFTAPPVNNATSYQFKLTITAEDGTSDDDLIKVTVSPASTGGEPGVEPGGETPNIAPTIAEMAPITANENDAVSLSATATDPEGKVLTYLWLQTKGAGVTLSGDTNAIASFTAPDVLVSTDLTFTLTVTDDLGLTSSADVVVTILPVNGQPKASITTDELSVDEKTTVKLSAKNSSDDGTIESYLWSQAIGSTDVIAINNATGEEATFTAPTLTVKKDYTFELKVTDNEGGTNTATVTITVLPVNEVPTVDAGSDQNVQANARGGIDFVNLTASIEDDGTIVKTEWTQTGSISVMLVDISDDEDGSKMSFNIDGDIEMDEYELLKDETITFTVTVTDDEGESASDKVKVTLKANDNQAPSVYTNSNVDNENIVNEGRPIELYAHAEDDQTAYIYYQWNTNSNAFPFQILDDPQSSTPKFSTKLARNEGGTASIKVENATYEYTVTVTDKSGASTTSDKRYITVQPYYLAKIGSDGQRRDIVDDRDDYACVAVNNNFLVERVFDGKQYSAGEAQQYANDHGLCGRCGELPNPSQLGDIQGYDDKSLFKQEDFNPSNYWTADEAQQRVTDEFNYNKKQKEYDTYKIARDAYDKDQEKPVADQEGLTEPTPVVTEPTSIGTMTKKVRLVCENGQF